MSIPQKAPVCIGGAEFIQTCKDHERFSHLIEHLEQNLHKLEEKSRNTRSDHRGEVESWRNSLAAMASFLETAGLQNLGVLIEFNPPVEGLRRADVILTGQKNGIPHVVVVELKQWSFAKFWAKTSLFLVPGANYPIPVHPVEQADTYAKMIAHYLHGFSPREAVVEGCAFLHNADGNGVLELQHFSDFGPRLFDGSAEGQAKFATFLSNHFDQTDGLPIARKLVNTEMRPTPEAQEAFLSAFDNAGGIPLTYEQRKVVNRVREFTNWGLLEPDRSVYVVSGGPGTGKTVVATQLAASILRELPRAERICLATNSAPLRASWKELSKRVTTMPLPLESARMFYRKKDHFDVVVVDEAQRISQDSYGDKHSRPDAVSAQLEEVVESAKVSIFLLDDLQQTGPFDFVTSSIVREVAEDKGWNFDSETLTEQHRNGGSKKFEDWVDSLVYQVPEPWEGDSDFEFKVVDSPEEMESWLTKKNPAHAPRILAGFCWPWNHYSGRERLSDKAPEVRIGQWSRRWNLNKAMEGFPDSNGWAFDEKASEQVGSVFAGQGFEFDYCGVILGPDLVVDQTGTPLRVNLDGSSYGPLVKAARLDPDMLKRFRNAYRVLLTRGRKGIALMSTDPETQRLLRILVE